MPDDLPEDELAPVTTYPFDTPPPGAAAAGVDVDGDAMSPFEHLRETSAALAASPEAAADPRIGFVDSIVQEMATNTREQTLAPHLAKVNEKIEAHNALAKERKRIRETLETTDKGSAEHARLTAEMERVREAQHAVRDNVATARTVAEASCRQAEADLLQKASDVSGLVAELQADPLGPLQVTEWPYGLPEHGIRPARSSFRYPGMAHPDYPREVPLDGAPTDVIDRVAGVLNGRDAALGQCLDDATNVLVQLGKKKFDILRLQIAEKIGFDATPAARALLGQVLGAGARQVGLDNVADALGLGGRNLTQSWEAVGGRIVGGAADALGVTQYKNMAASGLSLLGYEGAEVLLNSGLTGEGFTNQVSQMRSNESALWGVLDRKLAAVTGGINLHAEKLFHIATDFITGVVKAVATGDFSRIYESPHSVVSHRKLYAYVEGKEKSFRENERWPKVRFGSESVTPDYKAAARREGNTVTEPETFEYVDVGQWFGDRPHFCLIHRRKAKERPDDAAEKHCWDIVHCTWVVEGRYINPGGLKGLLSRIFEGSPDPVENPTLKAFLEHDAFKTDSGESCIQVMGSFQYFSDDPAIEDEPEGKIMLLLGDLHMPIEVPGGCYHGAKGFPLSTILALRSRWDKGVWCVFDWTVERIDDILANLAANDFRLRPEQIRIPMDPTDIWYLDAREWSEKYHSNNIHKNAGPPLLDLLLSIRRAALADDVVLCQLGDLYEMWVGMQFLGKGDNVNDEVILHDTFEGYPVRDLIYQRLQYAHKANTYPVSGRWVSLPRVLFDWPDTEYVYGNHESYFKAIPSLGMTEVKSLSLPDVRTWLGEEAWSRLPARELERLRRFFHGRTGETAEVQPLPVREANACREHVWMEHGHYCDKQCCDGTVPGVGGGPWFTNSGFVQSKLMHFLDGVQFDVRGMRETHIQDAVRRFVDQREAGGDKYVKVFAMAHTHLRFQATVEVVESRKLPENRG